MLLSDRRTALLGLLALSGCGFAPVYGTGGQGTALRGRVSVVDPADEEGFALYNRLKDRLGAVSVIEYELAASMQISEEEVGFLPDGEISRVNVIGRVDWTLTELASDQQVLDGRAQSFTSYSATSTTVATTIAQRDARRRLMVILADSIVADLLANDLS